MDALHITHRGVDQGGVRRVKPVRDAFEFEARATLVFQFPQGCSQLGIGAQPMPLEHAGEGVGIAEDSELLRSKVRVADQDAAAGPAPDFNGVAGRVPQRGLHRVGAHDLNNILGTITLLSDTSWRNDPAAGSPELREIHEAALNAAALTRELTTFSRREADEPLTPLDLREVVHAAAILVKPLLQKQARLVVNLPDVALPVLGDAGRLKQILVNLVINARDATPPDGEISVEAERWEEPEAGPQVRLTVRDTGRGMDEATRQRMFEPFFTTKGAGEGTGLGLATVKELVDLHHGRVEVHSTPGQGTTFHIYLPLDVN